MTARTKSIRTIGKHILVYLTLIAVGLVIGFAIFETYARFELRHQRAWPDRWAFRATQPPPYVGASYFSKPFIQESARAVAGLTCPPGKNELILSDFHGRWFNVRDTRRVTTDQPSAFRNHLYLFGGSTVFAQEVPDELTIASYLQRRINEAMPGQFRVENMGVPAVIAIQELETLESLRLTPGDKVIILDGANDVTYGVYSLTPIGWRPGADFPMVRRLSPFEKITMRLLLGSQTRFATLDLLQGRIDFRPPAHLTDRTALDALAELMARQRTSALLQADSIAKQASAEFFSFVQPNAFELPRQTEYRKSILGNPLLTPPGLELAFRAAAPVMARTVAWLESAGVKAADLSGVLTPISNSEEVYLDYVHANHKANQVIANELFRQVFQTDRRSTPHDGQDALRAELGRYDVDAVPANAADYGYFRKGSTVYAVPAKYGHVWWNGVDVAALPGVATGTTLDEARSRVRAAGRTLEHQVAETSTLDTVPRLLRSVGKYNLVSYRGRIYGIPQSLGPVNLETDHVEKLRGVITGATVEDVLKRLPQ